MCAFFLFYFSRRQSLHLLDLTNWLPRFWPGFSTYFTLYPVTFLRCASSCLSILASMLLAVSGTITTVFISGCFIFVSILYRVNDQEYPNSPSSNQPRNLSWNVLIKALENQSGNPPLLKIIVRSYPEYIKQSDFLADSKNISYQ